MTRTLTARGRTAQQVYLAALALWIGWVVADEQGWVFAIGVVLLVGNVMGILLVERTYRRQPAAGLQGTHQVTSRSTAG